MNLRPSGYEPDELPGCSIPRRVPGAARAGSGDGVSCQRGGPFLSRPGGDLLSHVLRRSTIGATALNGRVRDGIGCFARAMTTRPGKKRASRSCGQGAARVREDQHQPRPRGPGRASRKCGCSRSSTRHGGLSTVGPQACGRRGARRVPSAIPRRGRGSVRACGRPAEGPRSGLAVTGSDQACRAISTGRLNALLRVHLRPIDVVVFHGPQGRPCFEGGFPLRCLQRLSCPFIATQHCRWHDNWSTSGTFTPVLSY